MMREGSPPLRVWGREFDGFRRAVEAHSAAWPAGEVTSTWLGLAELQDAVLHRTTNADVLLVPADWLPALAAREVIRPLTPHLADDPPEGWPHAWSATFHEGIGWDRQVYGLPFHDGPQLLFTRPSLLESHGLGTPHTWSQMTAAMRAVHEPGGVSGTVLAGAPDGHNNVYDLVLQLWRAGGDLANDQAQIQIDTPAMRQALDCLRQIVGSLVPSDAHELDSTTSGAAFAQGRIGLCLNWAGYAELAADGVVADDFDCALAPTHDDGTPTTTVNAFWAACITTSSPHPDRAWDYLRHMATPAMDLATTTAGGTGTRLSTWNDTGARSLHPEYALFEQAHASSRPLPRSPWLPELVDILSELVDAAVWRNEDPAPAIAAAQQSSAELITSHPDREAGDSVGSQSRASLPIHRQEQT